MNILIINQPLNNRGDESAHKGLIRSLSNRYPDSIIKVLYPNCQKKIISPFVVTANNVQYVSYTQKVKFGFFKRLWLRYSMLRFLFCLHPTAREIANVYRESDVIVCAPGGISMGGFQNWDHLFFLHFAKYFRKPLAYYGRSFGPFPIKTKLNREYKKLSYEILYYFSFLSIRDHKTELLADEIGLKYLSTVDTAFLDTINAEVPLELKCQIKGKYMVFVPNLLVWHYNFKNRYTKEDVKTFFLELMKIVLAKFPNYQILMLPQTYGYMEAFKNDVNFFNELADELKSPNVVVFPDIYTSDVQQAIIKDCEFVVGARYHSIVFAINSGVPFVSLSYEHKMSGLLLTLNKEDMCIDITNALENAESLSDSLESFKKKLGHLKKENQITDRAKSIAQNCFDSFCCDFLQAKS